MARSRRKYRRSSSQRVASLVALALPAPIQRVADTRLGPMLIFIAVPAMIIFGLLQVNWQNGTPHLTINSDKAQEIREVARNRLNEIDSRGALQHLEQTAVDAWNTAQGRAVQSGYSSPQFNNPNAGPFAYGTQSGQVASGSTSAPIAFPSTKPNQSYQQPNFTNSGPVTNWSGSTGYGASQSSVTTTASPQANTLAYQQQLQQQQLYQQQLYQKQLYDQQQYQQQQYQQQQLFEQQRYQQQLYEQQLRQQQPSAQSTWQPQANPTYAQQYDQYGRSVAVPSGNATQNTINAYGGFPSNNSGRY